MVTKAVSIDDEVRPGQLTRVIKVEGNVLRVEISGDQSKMVRVAASSLLDNISLSTSTLAAFA